MPKKELSILMPAYNNVCVNLVKELAAQCSNIEGLRYEIVVADDGSKRYQAISSNREINKLDDCRFIERGVNSGRAAIRNFLTHEAKYANIMFLDSDVKIDKDDFVLDYLDAASKDVVVYGGIHNDEQAFNCNNLRCVYECAFELKNPASVRNTKPYQQFRTTNFMAPRDVMLRFPFDEGFKEYGYEDVLFGKTLKENNIGIKHIDNPVIVDDYDTNAEFIDKTQQALRTLHSHRKEMEGYSAILPMAKMLKLFLLAAPLRCAYRMYGNKMHDKLCGDKASPTLFNVYRILYYLSLK